MMIIRGINVYPAQIESALLKIEGTLAPLPNHPDREKGLDEMEVDVRKSRRKCWATP